MTKKTEPSGGWAEMGDPPIEPPAPIVPTCRVCGWATAHEDHSRLIDLTDGVCDWCASDIAAQRQTTVPQRILDWAQLAADLGVTA